ncbi:hypothetical protein Dda_3227 [Drechslerella dactyloides]|uniref:Uncharacterized protein n=1 Tax=Drechslerella dactyloides TaxID=74499 RepID=A0AAD6NL22_DREDA|nr:hypothetical protein Dda_3227 [Drechslerella dactyloides]
MSGMPEYRRDSADNIHVIYPANTNLNYIKAFDGYVPPRYTAPVPVSAPIVMGPPNPPEQRILGLRRRTFWILLALLILLIIGLAVGISVGVASSIKNKNNDNDNASAQDANAGPVTVSITPTPRPSDQPTPVSPQATVVVTETSVFTPTPTPVTHCQQIWKGTAPFCNGKCDVGFTAVRESSSANACDTSSDDTVIDSKFQPSYAYTNATPSPFLCLHFSLGKYLSRVPHFRFLALFSDVVQRQQDVLAT